MADRRAKKPSILRFLFPPAFALAAASYAVDHHAPDVARAPAVAPSRPQGSEGFARLGGHVASPARLELFDDEWLELTRPDARGCGARARPRLLDPRCDHAAESLVELIDGEALAVPAIRTTTTGATGWFGFDGLPAGRYALLATPAGDTESAAPILLREIVLHAFDDRDLEVALPAPAPQPGVVRTHEGEPIAGAEILAIDPRVGRAARTRSDPRGAFTLTGLDPHLAYHLLVRAAGYAPIAEAAIAPSDDEPLEVELEEAAALSGQVTREGRPVAGARVSVDALLTPRVSDAAGRFRIEGLAPGFHVVRVTSNPGEGRRLEVEAPEAGTRTLAVDLEPVCDLALGVTDEAGVPVEGAEVRLLAVDSIDHRAAETDAEGMVKLELMTLGTYEVDVRPPLAAASHQPGVGLGSATWTLTLPNACTQRSEHVALPGHLEPPSGAPR